MSSPLSPGQPVKHRNIDRQAWIQASVAAGYRDMLALLTETVASGHGSRRNNFFDLLADDVVFDFVITVPNYPRHVVGRDKLI